MGTNYYLIKNKCESCNRHEKIHIGKRSSGWKFSFHGLVDNIPHIISWEDWKREIENSGMERPIIDEYEKTFSVEEFFLIVENTKNEELNHFDYCLRKYPGWEERVSRKMEWKDEDDWSFSAGEFE